MTHALVNTVTAHLTVLFFVVAFPSAVWMRTFNTPRHTGACSVVKLCRSYRLLLCSVAYDMISRKWFIQTV